MRALCFGDVHLGAGADLGREPGERLAEQAAVLERIVEVANELAVDVTIFAGDAWERRRPVVAELDAFQGPISKLDSELIIVPGNHDVSHVGGITGYDVALFGRPRTLIAHEPGVFTMGDTGSGIVDVAMLPWTPRSVFVAGEGGGDVDEVNWQIAEKVVDVARGLRARCGKRAILVAHWAVAGAKTDTGASVDVFREPVLQGLGTLGFDAVVLGHIHRPGFVDWGGEKRDKPIFYVGSPMPLNFGEATGEERGAWLLEVGEKTSVFRIPIESRPLVSVTWSGAGMSEHDLVEGLEVDGAIVKAKIHLDPDAARRFDAGAMRRELELLGAHKVWAIQVDVERQEITRGVKVDESIDDLDAMKLWLDAQPGSFEEAELVSSVLEAHSDYLQEANR